MPHRRFHTLVFTAALGVAVAAPSAFAQSRADRADRNREAAERAADEGSNNRVSYESLPPPVKEALDRERGDRRVASVYRADRGDRSWYSVVVETRRHGDRVIRLSPRGYVLSVGDLNEDETREFRANPDRWYHSWLDRQDQREKHYYRDVDSVRATADHPDRVEWDRVPARVRATILRENLGEHPTNGVIRYRQKDVVVYQISLQDGPNRQHMIKCTPDGAIYEEGEFDSSGKFIPMHDHPKTVVQEDLPGRVKATVDREAPRGQIAHIDVMNRNGRDVYTVEIDTRAESRYLTISESGKVLSDISDKY